MLKKHLRIAHIANELYVSEKHREAGILSNLWDKLSRKESRLKKELNK